MVLQLPLLFITDTECKFVETLQGHTGYVCIGSIPLPLADVTHNQLFSQTLQRTNVTTLDFTLFDNRIQPMVKVRAPPRVKASSLEITAMNYEMS